MHDINWHEIPYSYPNDGEVVLTEYKGEYVVARYHKHGFGTPYFGDWCEWEMVPFSVEKRNVDRWMRIIKPC